MSENIANTDMQLKATSLGAWTPADPNDPLQVTVVTTEADKASAPNGKPILVKEITWTIVPTKCTLSSYTHVRGGSTYVPPPPGLGTAAPIEPSGTTVKCKALGSGELVLRKGDKGVCNGVFTLTASPFTPLPCQCSFEIDDAGQEKAKSE